MTNTRGLDAKKSSWAPAFVVGIYPRLCEIARSHGYALALHGTLQRDFDIIAIPWIDDVSDPTPLVKALCEEFDLEPNHEITEPDRRPHGRLSYSIPLWWGAYIDLSVLTRKVDHGI